MAGCFADGAEIISATGQRADLWLLASKVAEADVHAGLRASQLLLVCVLWIALKENACSMAARLGHLRMRALSNIHPAKAVDLIISAVLPSDSETAARCY